MKKAVLLTAALLCAICLFLAGCEHRMLPDHEKTSLSKITAASTKDTASEIANSSIETSTALNSNESTSSTNTVVDFDFEAFERRVFDEMPYIAEFVTTVDYNTEYDKAFFKKYGKTWDDSLEIIHKSRRCDIYGEPIRTSDAELPAIGDYIEEVYKKIGTAHFFGWIDWYENGQHPALGYQYYLMEDATILKLTYDGKFEGKLYDGSVEPCGIHNFRLKEKEIITPEKLLEDKTFYEEQLEYKIKTQSDPRADGRWPFDEWPEIFETKYGFKRSTFYVSINDIEVTKETFVNSSIIENIVIHTGVKSIAKDAFEDCVNLTDIEYYYWMENWKSFGITGNFTVHCLDGDCRLLPEGET